MLLCTYHHTPPTPGRAAGGDLCLQGRGPFQLNSHTVSESRGK